MSGGTGLTVTQVGVVRTGLGDPGAGDHCVAAGLAVALRDRAAELAPGGSLGHADHDVHVEHAHPGDGLEGAPELVVSHFAVLGERGGYSVADLSGVLEGSDGFAVDQVRDLELDGDQMLEDSTVLI